MSGFIKYFEDGAKDMSFTTEDEDIYVKYSEIWDKTKKLLKLKFSTNPIRDKKYIVTKLKIFDNVNKTTFTDDKIPKERNHYTCVAAMDIDSVLKIDKKVYPQVYFEQYKYKLKKRKPVDLIDAEIEISNESDSGSN